MDVGVRHDTHCEKYDNFVKRSDTNGETAVGISLLTANQIQGAEIRRDIEPRAKCKMILKWKQFNHSSPEKSILCKIKKILSA